MGSQTELSDPDELLEAGWRARHFDDRPALAHDLFTRSLELARLQENPTAAAKALLALSNNLMWYCPKEFEESDLTQDDFIDEASDLFRKASDASGIAACLRAQWKFDDSLEICQQINDQVGIIRSLERLSLLASSHERTQDASELCKKALTLARQLGNKEVLAQVLRTEGHCWHEEEQIRRAALLEAAELYGELGYRRDRAEALHICATTACDSDLALKEQLLESARCIWHELERYTTEAICLDSLADTAEERGDQAMAKALRERSEAIGKLPEPY